jgi:hypothetical protein
MRLQPRIGRATTKGSAGVIVIAASGPTAPPLAELLRSVPAFSDLPREDAHCLALLRRGRIEHYAAGEAVHIGSDLVVISSGHVSGLAEIWSAGQIVASVKSITGSTGSVTADSPSLVYRLPAADAAELGALCPRIATAHRRHPPTQQH